MITKVYSRYREKKDSAGHACDGRDLLNYCLNGDGHDKKSNRYETISKINLTDDKPIIEQFADVWKYARKNHTREFVHLIMSASKKEYDPENQNDIQRFTTDCTNFCNLNYPDRQILIVVQKDGKGGNLHAHCCISDVDMLTHKGTTPDQRYHKWIAARSDQFFEGIGVELDHGETRGKNEGIVEKQIKEKGGKSWLSDLRDKVSAAMAISTDRESFVKNLNAAGVDFKGLETYKDKNGNDRQMKYCTYTLQNSDEYTNAKGEPYRTKLSARGGEKSNQLGIEFDVEHVEKRLRENRLHAPRVKIELPKIEIQQQPEQKKKAAEMPEKSTIQAITDKPIEQLPTKKKSEDHKRRKATVKSAFSDVPAAPRPVAADQNIFYDFGSRVQVEPDYQYRRRHKKSMTQTIETLRDQKQQIQQAAVPDKQQQAELQQQRQQSAAQQYLNDITFEDEERTDQDDNPNR